jgi:hypothetical protein
MPDTETCPYCRLSTAPGPSGRRACRCVFRFDTVPPRDAHAVPRPDPLRGTARGAPDIPQVHAPTSPSLPFFSPSPWLGYASRPAAPRAVPSHPPARRPPGLPPASPLVILPTGDGPIPRRAG